mgnify:CR=1 FL=1
MRILGSKLFRCGRDQAVRIPHEFRLEGTEVYVRRVGNALVLLPKHDPWRPLIESLDGFSADFMEDREQPAVPPTEGEGTS